MIWDLNISRARLLGVRVVTPPGEEPLSVSDVARHLGMDDYEGTAELYRLITSARQWAEHYTGRALAVQTVAVRYGAPAFPLRLYRPPLRSLGSVTLHSQGVEAEEDTGLFYVAGADTDRPTLRLKAGASFASYAEEIEVRYEAGYEPGELPDVVREAMLLWIADRFDTRQSVAIGTTMNILPVSPETLLMPYKVVV